jgi:KDO2-lipid IV(A) lauroyltransferase
MTTLVLGLLRFLSWSLWRLGLRRARALGRALGTAVFHLLPIRRRVVLDNLAHAYPQLTDAGRRAIARDCYRQLGRWLVETLVLPRLAETEVSSLVRVGGVDRLRAAQQAGTGAIVCLAHLGNWELLGYAAAQHGLLFNVITKVLKGTFNERLHASRRRVFGELPPSRSFEAGCEILQAGGLLGLVVDQHRAGDKAVAVEFFGRRAATSPSPALFAERTGAPVFTAWMTLAEDDTYEVRVEGPLPVPTEGSLSERLQIHSQALAADLEQVIRQRPGEWFWVHRRWKLAEAEARAASVTLGLGPHGAG